MLTDIQLRTAFTDLCGTENTPTFTNDLVQSCQELSLGVSYRLYGTSVSIAATTSNQSCYLVTETSCTCPTFQENDHCHHLVMRKVILAAEHHQPSSHTVAVVADDLPPGVNVHDVLRLSAILEHEEGLSADEAYLEAIDTLLYENVTTQPTLVVVPTAWGTVLRRGDKSLVLSPTEADVVRQALNRLGAV